MTIDGQYAQSETQNSLKRGFMKFYWCENFLVLKWFFDFS